MLSSRLIFCSSRQQICRLGLFRQLNTKSFNLQENKPSKIKYEPKVFSTNPNFPINVEAIYHEPLRHEIKHHNLVAELHFRSYGIQNLEFFINFALRAAYYLGIPISGPIPLPTKKELWTVNRATFVKAKSKENFQRITHKRLVKAWDTNPEVLDIWFSVLNKYSMAGVGIKTNVFVRESLSALQELDDVTFNIEENNPFAVKDSEKENSVAEKVQQLLNDPVFKKHLQEQKK